MKGRLVIVGGGVMGVSIAWHAARRTDPIAEPVILLEKTELGAGSSGRSGAILRQHYSQAELAAMARDSLRVYTDFFGRTGHWIGFERTGVLTLAGPERPDHMALVERNIEMQRSIGIDTRRVQAAEIRRLIPGIEIGDGAVGAFEPGAGTIDPLATVKAIAGLARAAGATIRSATPVRRLLVEDGQVRGVELEDGLIEAEQVLVAGGPWTAELLAAAGVSLPLSTVRPEQAFAPMPAPPARAGGEREEGPPPPDADLDPRFAPTDAPRSLHPVLLDLETNVYARCEPMRQRTRVGKLDYHGCIPIQDPDAYPQDVSPDFLAWARRALVARLPAYDTDAPFDAEAALYTITPDAQALLGPVPGVEGLFVASGFSGHGFKLAPSVGEGMTQLLFGERVSAFDADFFAPGRFADGSGSAEPRAFGL